jgi:hypothetical protein
MYWLLRNIDDPRAAEAYVRWRANKNRPWDEDFESLDPVADETLSIALKIPRTAAVCERLRQLIARDPDDGVRRAAFNFWRRAATIADQEFLRGIGVSDVLFEEALKMRLKLRDQSASHLLVERMRATPPQWCSYAPLIYTAPGVATALEEALEGALKDPNELACNVFQHLPAEAVRTLVQSKNELLLRTPSAWPSLWRSGVPEAFQLIQRAIDQSEPGALQYFFSRGRFPFGVSEAMLRALAPVLQRFPSQEKERLADLALRNGHASWVRENLPEVIAGKCVEAGT